MIAICNEARRNGAVSIHFCVFMVLLFLGGRHVDDVVRVSWDVIRFPHANMSFEAFDLKWLNGV